MAVDLKLDEHYWTDRYEHHDTGWDVGNVSTPIKAYIDQLTNHEQSILVPGAGNGYEAEYLMKKGFRNTWVVDLSVIPLRHLAARCPEFPEEQLLHADFFELPGPHTPFQGFDLIIEQTFFCALNPELRRAYAEKMFGLLNKGGRLVGLLFDAPLNADRPPFGGSKEEYLPYFEAAGFRVRYFDPCHNSIPPRAGRELFIHLQKP